MSKLIIKIILILIIFLLTSAKSIQSCDNYECLKNKIIAKYAKSEPKHWSENVKGVKTHLITNKKIIALTFDACGSKKDGIDYDLINYLETNKIPATLFVTGKWIDKNKEEFLKLSKNPLFELENHGLNHKPCSVNGKSIYEIAGTQNVAEVVDEIELNSIKMRLLTGKKPKFYRSGTAYYDEISVKIAKDLGYKIAGFSILGDAGATSSRLQIKEAFKKAKPGSVAILHMNHPEKETAEGIMLAVPELKDAGYSFVKLEDYKIK